VTLRHATAAVACALAVLGTRCASITSDATAPIAIEFVLPHFTQAVRVEEFDTVPLGVRVLDRAGDTIAGAPVQVVSLNPDTLKVDTLPLRLIGIQPGPARLLAFSGSLHSNPLTVTVVRAPDSLARASGSAATDTVPAKDSTSAPLAVQLLDLRTDTTQALGLTGYAIAFAVLYPAFANPAAATVKLSNDSLSDTVITSGGVASVVVKRRGAPLLPDSVVVRASVARANGTAVRGSPVVFIVRFQ
jgi:hypothetical protein